MKISASAIVIAVLASAGNAVALDPTQQPLSQEALFYRCYRHITGNSAAVSPLLSQVKSNQITAINACMQVLRKANFVPIASSNLAGNSAQYVSPLVASTNTVSNTNDPEAVTVLNHMHGLHRTWFNVMDWSGGGGIYIPEYLDTTEAPAFITRLLFQPGAQYKEVVTGNYSVRSLRSNGPWVTFNTGGGEANINLIQSIVWPGVVPPLTPFIPGTGIDYGLLWGINPYPSGANSWISDDGQRQYSSWSSDSSGPYSVPRNLGSGGIMSLESYLLMNLGFPNATNGAWFDDPIMDPTGTGSPSANAGNRMPRRLIRNMMHDLMCRDAPFLHLGDINRTPAGRDLVADYKAVYTDQSKWLPFRISNTCMSCHAGLDPMSANFRSLVQMVEGNKTANFLRPDEIAYAQHINSSYSGGNDFGFSWVTSRRSWSNYNSTFPIYPYFPDPYYCAVPSQYCPNIWADNPQNNLQAETPPVPPGAPAGYSEYTMMHRDPFFSLRPGQGDLRYRDHKGNLTWQHIPATGELDGIANLGNTLAASDELYFCAASRYFKFFTGINVNVMDPTDDHGLVTVSPEDQYYRNVVEGLGTHLKTTQSLQTLIQDIMNLPLYQVKGLRGVAP